MSVKNYITPYGMEKLQSELNHLLRVERPEVVKLVQWAASNGDRSENADYIYGKRRLREIDRRVRFLTHRIELAVIVDPLLIQSRTVQFGATVTVSDENENIKTLTIVGTDEINTDKNRISWLSPIGQSLMGKSLEVVTIFTPQGEVDMEILKIEYLAID
jgi:transcription elongation factor GreB